MKINEQEVIKYLMKGIRGEQSQEDLSDALGFNFNQVYRWESSTTKITWREFITFCSRCQLDLQQNLGNFKFFNDSPSIENISVLYNYLQSSNSLDVLAGQIGCSRNQLGRWLKPETDPYFEQVLMALNIYPGMVYAFIRQILPIERHAQLLKIFDLDIKRNELSCKYPVVSFILNYMHTDYYKSLKTFDPKIFCELYPVKPAEVDLILKTLEECKTIQLINNKYEIAQYDIYIISDDPKSRAQRIKFLMDSVQTVMAENNYENSTDNNFRYMIYSASLEKNKKAREILARAHADINALLSEDTSQDILENVSMITTNFVTLAKTN